MDTNLIMIALFCGLWQFVSTTDFGYTLSDTLGQPVLVGALLGILTGQVKEGLLIGGSLELMYLGIIYPGGTVPACASSAALVAIPIALRTGLDAHAATVLAVPFGILGSVLWNLKYSINSTFTIRAERAVKKGNYKGLNRNATIYPLLLTFLLTAVPIFLANILAPTIVQSAIEAIPDWAMHGVEVAGGTLPAIGFAMAVYTIGKREFLPFFVIGFFTVIYLNVPTMGIAVFGVCIAVLYLFLMTKKKNEV
ncbi:PTS mannose/fructose/sorbose/N-acetylgalactosamine transporter subunit IIC [Amedibacillus sp. YH-ame10]